MNVNPKLAQVLGFLIKNDEERAKELLHEIFIEKAKAIHEEMMSHDDEEMEEEVGGTGDLSKDFTNEVTDQDESDMSEEIAAMEDEIDFEETMSEGDNDMEMPDDDAEMDMGGEDHEGDADSHEEHEEIMDKMSDLESALAELRAEFEKLEAEEAGEDHDEDEEEGEEEEEEEEESWHMDEDFDEIAESLDLEVVMKDMEKSVPAKDVGSASSGMSDGNSAKSPLPKSQTTRFGAKPVEVKSDDHRGYDREAEPKHSMDALKKADPDMKADNRRKTSTQGMSKQSKEGNKPEAAINKTAREFGADTVGKMSPLSKGGDNLK
jgi:hypothetical protein